MINAIKLEDPDSPLILIYLQEWQYTNWHTYNLEISLIVGPTERTGSHLGFCDFMSDFFIGEDS